MAAAASTTAAALPLTATRNELTDDREAMAAVRRGDREALEALLCRHQGEVFAYLRARLLEPADAEDLCQEVFLRCCAGKARLRRAESMGGWLIGIARNVLREHVRRTKRRKEVAWTELCLEVDGERPPAGAAADALPHLPACLESLGHSARQALELKYRENKRMSVIGELLGRTEGAVKVLMYRARQALRRCLNRKLGRLLDE